MNEQHDHLRLMYIAMSAVAGSVTALAALDWKQMGWGEIALTVFVGFSFAIFLVPWIAADWVKIDINNLRAICGVTYLGAMGSQIFIPLIIKKTKRFFGSEGEAA